MPAGRNPDPSRPFDVAIAGAGPAGGSLALRLAKAGARVALVDAGRFPRDKLCGEFLSPEAWGVLERLGLAGAIESSGYQAIRRVRLTTPRGGILEAEVAGPDDRPGIALSRRVLDDRIVREACAAGATLLESSRVGGPIVDGDRVVGLSARRATEGPIALRASIVVAADGRHSALVKQTGTSRGRSRFRPRLFGLKRHVAVADPSATEPEGTVGLHLVPGGYGGTCRIEDGLTNVCALLPESVLRRHRGDLDRLAVDHLGRNPVLARLWDRGIPAGDWKAVAGVRVETSSPRLAGIAYAGDCRGTVDPLGGQGMTMALLGAEVLAPRLLEALAAGDGFPPSRNRAYEAAWHRRFDRRIRLCRAFHHALIHPTLIDLGASIGPVASRFLAACYQQTRDHPGTIG